MRKNIPGYDYHITKDGRLFYYRKGRWYQKKPSITKSGHLDIRLWINGVKTHTSIHRLVAEIYIPNPDNKPCVCHKDNNPRNNRVENLYWGTQAENSAQMVRDGRSLKGKRNFWYGKPGPGLGTFGEKNFNSKYPNRLIIKAVKERLSGVSAHEVCIKYGINHLSRYVRKYKKGLYGKASKLKSKR